MAPCTKHASFFSRCGRVAYLNRNDDERNFYVNGQDNSWNFHCRVLLRNGLQSLQSLRCFVGGIVVHQHLAPFANIEAYHDYRLGNSCILSIVDDLEFPRRLQKKF